MRRALIVAVAAAAIMPAATARASGAHWCRQGDPPIYASTRTSCRFAGNIVTDYVNVCRESRNCHVRVSSPVMHKRYWITCHRTGASYNRLVYCRGAPRTGIWTRFSADI